MKKSRLLSALAMSVMGSLGLSLSMGGVGGIDKIKVSPRHRFDYQSQQDAVNCVVKARNRRERRDAKRRADYVESIVYNQTVDASRAEFLLGLNGAGKNLGKAA